ncbi:hypothetical protein FJQ54_02260 [Sandaracinobacter neustonicus]|uniref:Uncharacterized protein n=1 Tax=Sandaracinobacter neustonicus TaxID=1715348 RepID=A0A501XT01_9SPHN|nr:hypothetical protein [Sandaracinobacter neustonicus]TPE63700.1 hypothetical protein FJQ54_02260 [Sandaracinobacter neustonicus]
MADSPLDELDRLAARSLASREAGLRASRDAELAPRGGETPRRARPIWPWITAAILLAFALGLIGSPWFERQARAHLPEELRSDVTPLPDPRVSSLLDRVTQLELLARNPALPVVPQAPQDSAAIETVGNRLTALESQLAGQAGRIDAFAAEQSRTLSQMEQEDGRLRDLYLMAVTRRMVEAGRPLTPLEPALVARYQASDQASLGALLAWSRTPQTRQTLAARLQALQLAADKPTAAPAGWWDRLKATLGGLVTVREERGAEPMDASARLAAAKEAMAEGDLQLAVTTLQALPQTPALREWVADARQLLAAEAALGDLESKALDTAIAHLPAAVPAVPAASATAAPLASAP